jgi:hypothetical protein
MFETQEMRHATYALFHLSYRRARDLVESDYPF